MPPPTRDKSTRDLMAQKMAILVCLIGLVILQTLDDTPPQTVKQPKNDPSDAKSPPRTAGKVAHIMKLPVELLLPIFQHLAPSNVHPYLQGTSLQAYKQAQKNLRSVCLVSKHMDAVARRYLYQEVVVQDTDTLAYLLRTLEENEALGRGVKQLFLELPSSFTDDQYRSPNVAILESRPSFEEIQEANLVPSDYKQYRRDLHFWPAGNRPKPSFNDWAWSKEWRVSSLMLYEVLVRTSNLESFCLGMIPPKRDCLWSEYDFFADLVHSAMGFNVLFRNKRAAPFLPKLTQLQLLANHKGDGDSRYPASFLDDFLVLTSLRTIRSFRDDGCWSFLSSWLGRSVVNDQFENITCIDLQQSRYQPQAIFQFCTAFPLLERLSVSTDTMYLETKDLTTDLSAGLAKLTRLRELVLDVHYYGDVKARLGPHGTINLASLSELVTLRLPLYFLVEMQLGVDPFISDLTSVLPPSLKHLTIWANKDAVKRTMVRRWDSPLYRRVPGPVCHPRQLALDFFESVSSCIADHFRHLEEVTYCYGDHALRTACRCDEDEPCDRCESVMFLHPYAVKDSSSRMHNLSSRFKGHGIRLRPVQEEVQPPGVSPWSIYQVTDMFSSLVL